MCCWLDQVSSFDSSTRMSSPPLCEICLALSFSLGETWSGVYSLERQILSWFFKLGIEAYLMRILVTCCCCLRSSWFFKSDYYFFIFWIYLICFKSLILIRCKILLTFLESILFCWSSPFDCSWPWWIWCSIWNSYEMRLLLVFLPMVFYTLADYWVLL